MKDSQSKLFSFDELSEQAQILAYINWSIEHEFDECENNGYIQNIIDHIDGATGVSLQGWEYDSVGYRYEIDDLEMVMRPEFDSYNLEEYAAVAAEPRDMRAAKIALKVYYNLLEKNVSFGKVVSMNGQAQYGYYEDSELSLTERSRRSEFTKLNSCFTGHWLSKIFSDALINSVRQNYTNAQYTVLDHLTNAYDVFFRRASIEYKKQSSFDHFAATTDKTKKYLASGDEYFNEEQCTTV